MIVVRLQFTLEVLPFHDACTVVRTDAGLSESFEVKVDLHQGSVLSPLLFAAVMDVVSSEARSDLPSKLLYADDLIIMAPTMEQLGRRVADWRASLLGKGLKVNAGKSKVMVGSSGGKVALWCMWEMSTDRSILVLKALRRKYESLWRKTRLTVHFDMYSESCMAVKKTISKSKSVI